MNKLIKLNLQLFAEPGGEGGGDVQPVEAMISKKEYDKVASELAKMKKERLSDDEKIKLEMEEKDTKIAELEKTVTKSTLKSGLATSGLDGKAIDLITNAIIDGDVNDVVKSLNKVLKELNDKHSQEIEAIKLDSTPRPGEGSNGELENSNITRENFIKMSYIEKLELKKKNPELYNQLIK